MRKSNYVPRHFMPQNPELIESDDPAGNRRDLGLGLEGGFCIKVIGVIVVLFRGAAHQ